MSTSTDSGLAQPSNKDREMRKVDSSSSISGQLFYFLVALSQVALMIITVSLIKVVTPFSLVNGLFTMLIIDLAINTSAWFYSASAETAQFYDATGCFSFIVLSLYSLSQSVVVWQFNKVLFLRQCFATIAVCVWAVRLGTHLFTRSKLRGEDERFDVIKHRPLHFMSWWMAQALWVFIVGMPVYCLNLYNASSKEIRGDQFSVLDFAAIALWTIGFYFEAAADAQKRRFQHASIGHSEKPFIAEGLWKLSRHPNYFGEIVMWLALSMLAAFNLHSIILAFICMASPLFTYLTIRFFSGIPLVERDAQKRWSHLPAYQEYQRNTPLIFPKLFATTTASAKQKQAATKGYAGESKSLVD